METGTPYDLVNHLGPQQVGAGLGPISLRSTLLFCVVRLPCPDDQKLREQAQSLIAVTGQLLWT